MTPYDRGIRDLVPLFLEDPDEIGFGIEDDPSGRVLTSDLPQGASPIPQASQEAMRLPDLPAHATTATPVSAPAVLSSSAVIDHLPAHASLPDIVAPVPAVEFELFEHVFIKYPAASGAGRDGSGGRSAGEAASEPAPEAHQPAQSGLETPVENSEGGGGLQSNLVEQPADPVEGAEWEHDIAVTQIADVDQDATIVVQGYMGSVVSRFHIDQKIVMDQDAEIDVNIDGNGHFAITIDQKMYISQQTDVDLKIFDEDGVLYVELYLRDVIEVDQDTSVLFNMYDGFGDHDLVIIQDLDMDQDVDVDIDVEDDLEERYAVKVDVSVLQDADADEEANLQITNHAGELEVDLEANQVANVDQETFVKIDFALV